ncbi:MAG: hypothetical protein ACI8RD_009387, partial [Bacillariaceae sp.]
MVPLAVAIIYVISICYDPDRSSVKKEVGPCSVERSTEEEES